MSIAGEMIFNRKVCISKMKTSRKLISMLLAVLMVLTSLTAGLYALAADDTDPYREELTSFVPTPVNKEAIGNDYLNAEGGMQVIVDSIWPALADLFDKDGSLNLADGLDGYLKQNVYTAATLNKIYDSLAELSHNETQVKFSSALATEFSTIGVLFDRGVLQSPDYVSGQLSQLNNQFEGAAQKIAAIQLTDADKDAGITLADKIADIEFTANDFGFIDGDRDGFVDALLAVLRPITMLPTNRFLQLAGITINMFDTRDAQGNVTRQGIYSILLPTLEQLGLTDLPTPKEYEANYYSSLTSGIKKANDEYLRPIIESFLKNVVDPVAADPLNGLIEVLPRIAYVVDNDRLDTAVKAAAATIGTPADAVVSTIDLTTDTINEKIAATTVDLSSSEDGIGLFDTTTPVVVNLKPVDWTAMANAAYVNLAPSSTSQPYFVLRTGETEIVVVELLSYVFQIFSDMTSSALVSLSDALVDTLLGDTFLEGILSLPLKAVLAAVMRQLPSLVSKEDGVGLLLTLFTNEVVAGRLNLPALKTVSMRNTSSAHGKLDPSGLAVSGAEGGRYVYTANADDGYVIKSLTVNGQAVEEAAGQYHYSALAEVGSGLKVTYVTEGENPGPVQYMVSATAGSDGQIDPLGEWLVDEGESRTFTITANDSYVINQLTVNGVAVSEAAGQKSYIYTIPAVDDNYTIRATFRAVRHILTATAGANGSISPSGITNVRDGDSQTYTVKANSGYVIEQLTANGTAVPEAVGKTSYTYVITPTENTRISASFVVAPVRRKAQVMVTSLNVKASPSNSSSTVIKLVKNELAYIDGENGDWYQVSFRKAGAQHTGYLEKKYVKIIAGTPKDKGVIVAKSAKVYTSTMESSVAYTLDRNLYVYLDNTVGNYYLVSFSLNGWHYGYVRKDYVRDCDLPRTYESVWNNRQALVMVNEVIVRDADGNPVTVLYKNNKVYINGEGDGTYKVSFKQYGEPFNGYVDSQYFKISSGTPKDKGIVVAKSAAVYTSTAATKIEYTLDRNLYVYIDKEVGNYYLVSFSMNGWHYGYIRKDYVRDNSLPRDYVSEWNAKQGYVKQSELVVRDSADTASAPVTVLYNGNKVYINGEEGNWYKVSFKQYGEPFDGYVLKTDLNV